MNKLQKVTTEHGDFYEDPRSGKSAQQVADEFKAKVELPDLDKLKKKKIAFIDSYKHEARLYFPYGNCGGVQRFMDSDILFINITIEGFKNGMVKETEWKYSNGNYDVVTDVSYLEGMLVLGSLMLARAFEVEKTIVLAINSIEDIEVLKAYDAKAEFDKIYFDPAITKA